MRFHNTEEEKRLRQVQPHEHKSAPQLSAEQLAYQSKVRDTVRRDLLAYADRLNAKLVKQCCSDLSLIGSELQSIEAVVRSQPERLKKYRRIVDELTRRGAKRMRQLTTELERSGVLTYLANADDASFLVQLGVDFDEFLASEGALFSRLGLTSIELSELRSLFSSQFSLSAHRLLDYTERFRDLRIEPEPPSDDTQRDPTQLWLNRTHGVSKIFLGSCMVGFDILGFWATAGLLVPAHTAVVSTLSGANIAMDGAKLLDEADRPPR